MTVLSWLFIALFILASVHITLYAIMQFQLLVFSRGRRNELLKKTNFEALPFVTVQLPIYNEKYVVEDLLLCVCQLEYPSEKLEFQILDDSTDETTGLIKRVIKGFPNLQITHLRRPDRVGYKASALAYGLGFAKGSIVAIFDADFRPEPDFLLRTVPYFENARVGALQTRWGHINEEVSALTKLQSIILNNHFLIEQPGRYQAGLMLQFNGTAGLWRRSTIEAVGGWQADTLTEDLDLSYRAQLAGWEIVFLRDVVCKAEIPPDLRSLKIQQFRWMQGGAENARKHIGNILRSDFTLFKKLHASMHLLSSFVFVSILFTALLSVPMIFILKNSGINPAWLSLFSIGLLLNGVVFFYANYYTGWSHLPRMQRIGRFMRMFPLLMVYCLGLSFHNTVAIIKGILHLQTPFHRTPKFGENRKEKVATVNNVFAISLVTFGELALAMYFMSGVVFTFYKGDFSFLLYDSILVFAYLLVIWQSSLNRNAFSPYTVS